MHSFCSQSTPESWAQNSHDNIVSAQNQLMASIQLRSLIDSILTDISRDMREQADVVETEFGRRIAEMSDAMQKMTYNMREVIVLPTCFRIVDRGTLVSDAESHCRKREEDRLVARIHSSQRSAAESGANSPERSSRTTRNRIMPRSGTGPVSTDTARKSVSDTFALSEWSAKSTRYPNRSII